MSLTRRVCVVCMLAGLVPAARGQDGKSPSPEPAGTETAATTPQTGADDEFLEFLGSIDTDGTDEDWLDYLGQTDIAKVAKAKKKTRDAAEVNK